MGLVHGACLLLGRSFSRGFRWIDVVWRLQRFGARHRFRQGQWLVAGFGSGKFRFRSENRKPFTTGRNRVDCPSKYPFPAPPSEPSKNHERTGHHFPIGILFGRCPSNGQFQRKGSRYSVRRTSQRIWKALGNETPDEKLGGH